MALTTEQRALLIAKFASFTNNERTLLGDASATDLSEGVAGIISNSRVQSISAAVASLVTGSVNDWTTLYRVASVADGATLYPLLAEFETALNAANAPNMVAAAVAFTLAGRKHFPAQG